MLTAQLRSVWLHTADLTGVRLWSIIARRQTLLQLSSTARLLVLFRGNTFTVPPIISGPPISQLFRVNIAIVRRKVIVLDKGYIRADQRSQ